MTNQGGTPIDPTTISARPDNLRAVSARLAGFEGELQSLTTMVKDIHDSVRREASVDTLDGSPAPVYSPQLDSLATVTRKVIDNLGQLQANVMGDATALKELADKLEGTDHASGERIKGVTAP